MDKPEDKKARRKAKQDGYSRKYREKNPEEYREKQRQYQKAWRDKNLEKSREKVRRWHEANKEQRKQYLKDNRDRLREYKKQWAKDNPEKVKNYADRYRNTHPNRTADAARWRRERLVIPEYRIRNMFKAAETRALKRGFAIDAELLPTLLTKIPTACACCQKALDYSMQEGRTRSQRRNGKSPSLDRIDNSKGYTVQNVAVICIRCNTLKNDATRSELKLLAAYMDRECALRGLP